MQAYLITDKEYQTDTFTRLSQQVEDYFRTRGWVIEQMEIGQNDLAFCKGCFGCWVKKPGECVINDSMAQINSTYMNSDIVVYLSPIVFGQFSANIKNTLDRWIPNILPFFETRPDGSTMHPARYKKYPNQIIIGYGDDLDDVDRQLFADITQKHRRGINVFIYEHSDENLIKALENIILQKAGALL